MSDWVTITQEQVNQFAEATGDHQWIHVDIEKAKAGPYGGTIAHGFLTLSLIPAFFLSSLNILKAQVKGAWPLSAGAFRLSGVDP